MNIVAEYIKYLATSKRRHGVHSPFMYEFGDKVLKTSVETSDKKAITVLVNALKNNSNTIEIKDYGAGSKRLKKQRKINDILKTSSSQGKYGELLYKLCKFYKPNNILEFGTSLGIGSAWMKLGNPNSNITTVEGCPNTFAVAKTNLASYNVEPINAVFTDYLKNLTNEKFNLVFIDGHHDGKATINYVNALKNHAEDNTIFILDDIRWNDDMFKAWQQLVQDQDFHVSIDIFRMGILIPRKTQEKQHFSVRF